MLTEAAQSVFEEARNLAILKKAFNYLTRTQRIGYL
jgi:hypothetical protein